MRILIAGFAHETNTFAVSPATYESFLSGEGYPPLARGDAILPLIDVNLPIGGFMKAMRHSGHILLPVIWAAASPSAHVTEDAFERIAGEIVEAARAARPDALYLDLHGAMVAAHLDDGEGELLARLRQVVGPGTPIVASLDLHANVTARMLSLADALVAFRTYPHVDNAVTGARAAALLQRLMAGERFETVARRLPFLIPINGGCTLFGAARDAYARLACEETPALSLSFAQGFPAADFPECGPVVWGHGPHSASVAAAVEALASDIVSREADYAVTFYGPDEAVGLAKRLSSTSGRPVVIADTQDNPGSGANSDTTGLLRALLAADVQGAALGLMFDPRAAKAAHQAGLGSAISLALGGRTGVIGDAPLQATFQVEHLSDGHCLYAGPMMTGAHIELGPVAGLRIGGVRIAVSSCKAPMQDRNLFRVAGIQPEAARSLVVKSSVHFRADFAPIAEHILVAKAPGPFTADPTDIPWTRLTPGIRVGPGGRAFAGAAA